MKNKDIGQLLLYLAIFLMAVSYFFQSNKNIYSILWFCITIILFLASYFISKKRKEQNKK